MEFVKGRPITEFCDRQKLGIADRLRLFEQACEAIQDAHLKGIVHRDITPRNILAFQLEGEEPKLKVIDFGLAKAMGPRLGDRSLHTQSNWAVGTPAYMSPEQANPGSSDIDTQRYLLAWRAAVRTAGWRHASRRSGADPRGAPRAGGA
jgi:serine/threonine protein kinase